MFTKNQLLLWLICVLLIICDLLEIHGSPLQIKTERGLSKILGTRNKINPIVQNINNNSKQIQKNSRLPITVIPTAYELQLLPILDELPNNGGDEEEYEKFTAPGHIRIFVTCVVASDTITLHKSPVLKVDEKSVSVTRRSNNEFIRPIQHSYDNSTDFYIITLEKFLIVGSIYEINAIFIAPINEYPLDGLYQSFYIKPNSNETTYLAATQFQSVFARKVFPCFDEPHLKSTFEISIGRNEAKHITLSNSKLESTRPIANLTGWVWDKFERTVKMSTYLIAIVVSDFEYIESPNDPLVKVYAEPHLISEGGGNYAAETSAKQLDFFEKLFKINYTMGKMDSIAIPHFDAGAMENWGLNTYRTRYLLYFEGKTTEQSRGLISNILAHELAHQWLGNLVTCIWWSDIWLNEGFATFFSYLGWNETHPEFEPLKYFINDVFQYSMLVDANPSITHPVRNDALTTEEIESYFDGITYEKAASLIRMMEGFLGQDIFMEALIIYMNEKSSEAVNQNDLFRYLNNRAQQEENLLPEGGTTVQDIMDTWTLQSSFPLVRVSTFGTDRILLSQERYSESKFLKENTLDTNNLWYIPIALITENSSKNLLDHKPKLWIEPYTGSKIYHHNTSTWIMLNPDAIGYYRVLYDLPLTQLILQQLQTNHEIISPQSRSQLLDDYLNFATQNYINIETALQFTKYLSKENERIVWEAALGNLENILSKLKDTAAFFEFKQYMAPKLQNALDRIGMKQLPTDKGAIVLLRALLLDWSNQVDLPDFISYANELFNDWKTNMDLGNIPIPVDIRPVIYCAGVAMINGGTENFKFIFELYEDVTDVDLKLSFLNSLGCARESNLLQSVLDEILKDPSRIVETDKFGALQIIASSNSIGRSLTLRFMRENIDDLVKMFNGTSEIIKVVSTLSSGMDTVTELDSVNAFITENPYFPEDSLEDIRRSLIRIESNIAWRVEYEKRLQFWFSENI